jgi:hypothetical protein
VQRSTRRAASEKRPSRVLFFARSFCCNNFQQAILPLNIEPDNLLGMSGRNDRTGVGGASVDRDLKVAKKPYSAPAFQVLDAGAAKAELEAPASSDDANVRQMLSVLKRPSDGKPAPAPSTPATVLP